MRSLAATAVISLDDSPKTLVQRLEMDLMREAIGSGDARRRAEARSEVIDRTVKPFRPLSTSGSFTRTHEEELVSFDNPEPEFDDAKGEGDTTSAAS